MSLKTAWLNLQDGLGNRFAWSHVNAIYYSQAQNKLLKTKLDEMETAINAKVAKTDIVQVESTSQSTVPSSAYLKTVKDEIDSEINTLSSGSSGELGNNIFWSKLGKLVLITCGSYTFSIEAWANQNICSLPFPIYGHAVYYSGTLAQNKETAMENNLRIIAEDGYLKINAWGSKGYDNASIAFSLLYITNE